MRFLPSACATSSALSLHKVGWFLVVHCLVERASAGKIFNDPRSCLVCIENLRGGETRPHFPFPHSPTLGDVDKDGFYRPHGPSHYPAAKAPPPLIQYLRDYLSELRKHSPTLFNGILGSVFLFLLWQFPTSSMTAKILRNHFTTSSYNVVQKKRFHCLLSSAFSHASFHHLVLNMYAFLTFGRSAKQVLATHGLDLWPFVFSAAIFGNVFFLIFDRGRGSCVGLSGVTLALLAFDSLVYPTKELRLLVSFIPITLPAYYLFIGLLGYTILGMLGAAGSRNIAHSTHLGGLLYGALMHQTFKQGWSRQLHHRLRKFIALLGADPSRGTY